MLVHCLQYRYSHLLPLSPSVIPGLTRTCSINHSHHRHFHTCRTDFTFAGTYRTSVDCTSLSVTFVYSIAYCRVPPPGNRTSFLKLYTMDHFIQTVDVVIM